MEYVTIKEISKVWGLSERRIQEMCKQGRIPGVIRFGHGWAIPRDSVKPKDNRIKNGKYIKNGLLDI